MGHAEASEQLLELNQRRPVHASCRHVGMRGIASVVVLAGCVAPKPVPVYSVRRSALVPHTQPPMRTGHAPDGSVRFTTYDSTVLVPVKPTETAGANAGLYIARHNIGGSLDITLSERTDLALLVQGSLLRGAMAVANDAARPPDTDGTMGAGFELAHAFALSDQVDLGVVAGALHLEVPFFEEGRCIANCTDTGSGYYSESGEHGVTIWSLSLIPSYRDGNVTVFAGVTLRNHPTNSKFDTETATSNAYDDADELRGGPMYTILGGGLEWAATRTIKLLALVHRPVSNTVVHYGPAFGFALSFDVSVPRAAGRWP